MPKIRYFFPSSCSLGLALLSLGLVVFGCPASLLFGRSEPLKFWTNAIIFMGLFVLSLTALGLIIAALIERRPPPRLLLGCSALLALLAAGVLTSIGMYLETGPEATVGLWILTTPLLALFSVPVLAALLRTPPELRRLIQADQDREIPALLAAWGGSSDYAGLARALRVPEAQIDGLLAGMQARGVIRGHRLSEHRRFYTPEAWAERIAALSAAVASRGQIRLDDLATEFQAPAGLVKDWLHAAVQSGKFSGYINWKEGLVYSVEAKDLLSAAGCPQCGGELALAGKGVAQCRYCGCEVFRMGGEHDNHSPVRDPAG